MHGKNLSVRTDGPGMINLDNRTMSLLSVMLCLLCKFPKSGFFLLTQCQENIRLLVVTFDSFVHSVVGLSDFQTQAGPFCLLVSLDEQESSGSQTHPMGFLCR